ncbi:DMT family transporter [Streptomyces sp. A7024]|uniref:DMT family transporter n=1 Tax=Streptomyces coryli TaxID=1128680 RepID=A0A6G4TYM6_9ACTN|nr:DMT family transporter [Streptomyces coryli]NGN64994.1 DMT family transporter [Streptomyces coryli]
MSARGWILFVGLAVVWGVPYLMIKVAVGEVSPSLVVFSRCAIGAALLLPFALRQGGMGRVVRRHWLPLLGFAAFEVLGPWYLLSDAERHLSSGTTGLIVAAVPVLSVFVARLLGSSERLGGVRWLGLAVGFSGVAVLSVPTMSGGGVWPVTEALLTAVGYSIAPLIAARYLSEVPTLQVIAPCLLLATFLYAPAAALTWPSSVPSAEALMSLVGLGAICTALGFVIFLQLLREVPPSRAMVFVYLTPVVAVTAGVAFLDEEITWWVLVSFVLTLAGSVLATARSKAAATSAGLDEGPALNRRPTRPDAAAQSAE